MSPDTAATAVYPLQTHFLLAGPPGKVEGATYRGRRMAECINALYHADLICVSGVLDTITFQRIAQYSQWGLALAYPREGAIVYGSRYAWAAGCIIALFFPAVALVQDTAEQLLHTELPLPLIYTFAYVLAAGAFYGGLCAMLCFPGVARTLYAAPGVAGLLTQPTRITCQHAERTAPSVVCFSCMHVQSQRYLRVTLVDLTREAQAASQALERLPPLICEPAKVTPCLCVGVCLGPGNSEDARDAKRWFEAKGFDASVLYSGGFVVALRPSFGTHSLRLQEGSCSFWQGDGDHRVLSMTILFEPRVHTNWERSKDVHVGVSGKRDPLARPLHGFGSSVSPASSSCTSQSPPGGAEKVRDQGDDALAG